MSTVNPYSIKSSPPNNAEHAKLQPTPRVEGSRLQSSAATQGNSAHSGGTDGAAVIQVGPELPSADSASAMVDKITKQLSANPSQALDAMGAMDQSAIQRLLLED